MPSVSKAQQGLMGAAYRCKKSGDCASDEVKKLADSMSLEDLKKFASTDHEGLPQKVAKESITFREYMLLELNSAAEMREVEQHLTQMFSELNIPRVRFTGHGGDDRALGREEDVTAKEISEIFFKFKKMHAPKMLKTLNDVGRFQAVIKDYKSHLNVVIDVDPTEMRIVTMKRKHPNEFKTKGGAQSHRGDKWQNYQQLKVW